MKVLFIGNSHTYFNDMPELFRRFAEAVTGEKTEAVMLAYSGRDLEWHRKEYFAVRYQLLYGHFDYCVIQQAAHPFPPAETTLAMGKELISLCRRTDTVPVVYLTWAEKRFPENQQKMNDTLSRLAGENDALLAPVGIVWQKVLQEHPDISLFWQDGEHAGPYGSFLIAAVFCRLLAGRISSSLSGQGQDFLQNRAFDLSLPRLAEDPAEVRTELVREKTDAILAAVAAVFGDTVS